MKKLVAFVVVMCALFYYYLNHDKPDNKRVLRVGIECDYIPNNWQESKPTATNLPLANEPGYYAEGYDIQIAKIVAEALDANLVAYKIPWEELLNALNQGQIDMIFSGMVDSEEHKKEAAFSNLYDVKKTEYAVLVRGDNKYANARTLVDLKGATMLGQKGTKLDTVIDQILNVHHLPPLENITSMVEALKAGKVDGIVINVDTGQSYERLDSSLVLIRFPEHSGFELGFNGICAGVRKEDVKLLEDINNAIDNIPMKQRQKLMDQTIARIWENL